MNKTTDENERSEQLAAELLQLLAIDSPSYHERALADTLEARLGRDPAWRVQRVGDNLLVRPQSSQRARRLLFCAHLDTVPNVAGHRPVRRGDRIYGVGASDLKSGLAVLLGLLQEPWLLQLPVEPWLALYAREEVGFAESGLEELHAACPELKSCAFGICVEPTDNAVELGCLGTLHAEVSIRGQAAHSARPWQGKNAIHAALPFLRRCAEFGDRVHQIPEHPDVRFVEVLNVTTIHGGHAKNVIPESVVINVNLRFAPDRSAEDARNLLDELLAGDGSFKLIDLAPPGRVACDNPMAQALFRTVPDVRAKQAWTDVGRLSGWGIDAVSLGPGLTAQAHQVGEYATVSGMVTHFELMQTFLRSLKDDRSFS